MWKLLGLVSLQTIFLSAGQVMLKFALKKLEPFEWSWKCFKMALDDFWLWGCGISFGVATFLWLYILKNYEFSQAYPLTSLGFVFGMIAALIVFGESIPFSRWIGLVLVVVGCFLIGSK